MTSGADHTDRMNDFARRRVAELAGRGFGGYILKRGSPSCGMERVKLYAESGARSRSGTGLFARALGEALPLLPVEDEGRLENARRRENFITRVFAYRRLAALRESRPRPADVAAFHAAHEYLLLAHRPAAYARLGGLVAELEDPPRDRGLDRYRDGFMRALCVPATPEKHGRVRRRIMSVFVNRLSAREKRELLGVISDHGRGLILIRRS